MKTIPALPNHYPYNELLLAGRLSAKSRTWRWGHTGPTLLYTSQRSAPDICEAHALPTDHAAQVLVGVGDLVSVREFLRAELDIFACELLNDPHAVFRAWGAARLFRYEFRNLRRFLKPVSFKPPQGAVRVFNVPERLVRAALAACEYAWRST